MTGFWERWRKNSRMIPHVLTWTCTRQVVPSTGMGKSRGEVRVRRGKSSLIVRMNNNTDKMALIKVSMYWVSTICKHSTYTNSFNFVTTLRSNVPLSPCYNEDTTKKQRGWEICQRLQSQEIVDLGLVAYSQHCTHRFSLNSKCLVSKNHSAWCIVSDQ